MWCRETTGDDAVPRASNSKAAPTPRSEGPRRRTVVRIQRKSESCGKDHLTGAVAHRAGPGE